MSVEVAIPHEWKIVVDARFPTTARMTVLCDAAVMFTLAGEGLGSAAVEHRDAIRVLMAAANLGERFLAAAPALFRICDELEDRDPEEQAAADLVASLIEWDRDERTNVIRDVIRQPA